MKKFRSIVTYKNYFENFLISQEEKVQNKIYKILEIIEMQQYVPSQYLKYIKDSQGLYEARIQLGNNIWRVFCFFENDKLIILLNGFQKKSQRTPVSEIKKAKRLMKEYFKERSIINEK